MVDAVSLLTHLLDRIFLHNFNLMFTHQNPWRLLSLPSVCKLKLTSMMDNKCYLKILHQRSSKRHHSLELMAQVLQLASNFI